MVFDRLLTDTVTLIKRDGTTVDDIKANVQLKNIFIQRHDLLIETGDLVQRKMSNGGEETYEVIDPGFHEKLHRIPAGYQMVVRKLGIPEAKSAIHSVTFNVSGNNARINQNSVDKSINVVQMSSDIAENLEGLRREIIRKIEEGSQRTETLEVLDAIEQEFKSGLPKRSVVGALVQGLPGTGAIASIGSFLLSCLE